MADEDRRKIAVAQTTSFCRSAAAMTFLVVLRGTVPQLKMIVAVGVMRDLYRVILLVQTMIEPSRFIPPFRRVASDTRVVAHAHATAHACTHVLHLVVLWLLSAEQGSAQSQIHCCEHSSTPLSFKYSFSYSMHPVQRCRKQVNWRN